MKKDGVLRIVVPDFEKTCEEYLRILSISDNDENKKYMYEWITIELFDQLTRTKSGGEMSKFLRSISEANNVKLREYVSKRTKLQHLEPERRSLWAKLLDLTPEKISTRLVYYYLKFIGFLIPENIKSMVMIETSIGERHRWMYDFYGLKLLCEKSGFGNCKSLNYNESSITGFCDDHLDVSADGTSYKNNSIYLEAKKV